MVIDALRTDHVLTVETDLDDGSAKTVKYLDYMPYTAQHLIKTQNAKNKKDGSSALGFEVITSMPTVTAPRIQVSSVLFYAILSLIYCLALVNMF